MANLNPYLFFPGQCREAMNFYQKCFGGELEIKTFEDSPMAKQMPESERKKVMHSVLKSGPFILMASDGMGPEPLIQGNKIVLSVNCESEEEVNRLFKQLSEEGKVISPLEKQFWGGTFGVLNDRFDMKWLFHYEG
jgi:PhnB protein